MTMMQAEPFAMNVTHSQVNNVVEILALIGFDNRYNLLHDSIMKRSNYKATGTMTYTEPFGGVQLVVKSDTNGNIEAITVINYGNINYDDAKLEKINLELSLLFP